MSVVSTGYAKQGFRPASGRLYGFSMWDRGDTLHYHSADNHEEGGYWLTKAGEDDMLAHRIDADEFDQWISEEPLPQYPVIFRRMKDNGGIDIWFPTVFEGIRGNVLHVQVATQYEGHTSGTRHAMLMVTEPIQPTHPEVLDVKEKYERQHDVILIPYMRWQPRFTEELDRQYREWKDV